tara:strand:- start:745 stop:2052 length:1308 start_codon:yes stop_codon:yes gene_type:complete
LKHYDVVVLGLGVTGYAALEYCLHTGRSVAITDDRERPPLIDRLKKGLPHVPASIGAFDYDLLAKAEKVLVSPGIRPDSDVILWLKRHNKPIISDIDLFLEAYQGKILAVTGSNGKSTTVKMLHDLIKVSGHNAAMVGNIGKPVLSLLTEGALHEIDWVVLEISSFQLFWSQNIHFDIGVLLNIYPNHLDWHSSYREYRQTKMKLLEHSDVVVMPKVLEPLAKQHGIFEKVRAWIPSYSCLNESSLDIDNTIIEALPYALHKSAIASWITSDVMQIEKYHRARALEEFKPWPFRCQHETNDYGNWYNDAKSSNLAAARYAIESVSRKYGCKVIWIAGGVTKNEEFALMSRWVSKFVSLAVIYGQDRQCFLDALIGVCPVSPVETLDDAIRLVVKTMRKSDVVVFSPAAASFDQFENFQHRGQFFSEQLVNILPVA